MRIEQLVYFTQVVKYGSINAAAEKLFITQPALGSAIRALEKELGYPLFNKDARGSHLTKWGEQTYLVALEMLEQQEKFKYIKQAFQQTPSENLTGKLNISTIKTLSLNTLPQVISIFSAACPEVELSVIEYNTMDAIQQLKNGGSDLALINVIQHTPTLDPLKDFEPDYHLEPLWDEKLYALMSSKFDISKKRTISLQQLQEKPLAGCAFSFDDYLQSSFIEEFNLFPKVAFRASNFDLVQEYIINTNAFGFAFISSTKNIEKTFRKEISLLPVKENVVARFYAIYHKGSPQLKQIETFLNILLDFCDSENYS